MKQVRALLLLLVLCSGWAAVPVALAVPEPVTCGMICCDEAGVCYCAHPHKAEPSSGPQLKRVGSACAERCAGVAAVSLKLAAARLAPSLVKPIAGVLTPLLAADATPIQTLLLACDCSPRAPPQLLSGYSA